MTNIKNAGHFIGFFTVLRRKEPNDFFNRGALVYPRRELKSALREHPEYRGIAAEAIRCGIKNARATFP